MPEQAENVQVQDTQNQTNTDTAPSTLTPEQIEFQGNMALAFEDVSLIPPKPENTNPDTIVGDAPILPNDNIQQPPVTDDEIVDANAYIKEQLGFDDWETAKTEIEKLKATQKAEIQFADEESKRIHELIRTGNKKAVSKYLQAQDLLEDSDSMNNEQKLKLYIRMQNPKFDKELIDDEYNSLYVLEEDSLSELEPLAARKKRIQFEQRLESDVEKAQEYFSQYKQKIQLPEIQPATKTIDEEYEAEKANNAKATEYYNNIMVPAIMALKESDVQLSFKVEDSNNQMNFPIVITPTKEDFEKAKQDSLSALQFLQKTSFDKDGKFLPQQLQKVILLAQNFDNYAQSIARQAVNEERKRVIAKEAPNGNGSRDFNVNTEKTEFQKKMEYALS